MKEHEKAKRWRESWGLSTQELGELIGYSKESCYWMERGETPPRTYLGKLKHDRTVDPYVWKRYKMACWALDNHLRNGARAFGWSPK